MKEGREGWREGRRGRDLCSAPPPISSPDKAHLEKLKGNGDCHAMPGRDSRKEAAEREAEMYLHPGLEGSAKEGSRQTSNT